MHSHAHGTCAPDPRTGARKRLTITLLLVLGYMTAEIVGGIAANSLALLADAGHMLADAGALGLSLFALWIAQQPPTPRLSYGYYRAEILAALANGAALGVIAFFICWEACERLGGAPQIQGKLMLGVAVGGLLVNLAGLWLLHGDRSASLNVQGAWLHVLADTLGSVAAIVAAGLIWFFAWTWADAVASVAIALLVLYSAWGILKQAVAILMEGTPNHLDLDQIRDALMAVDGVRAVHDLHVWTISSGLESLSAHVVIDDAAQYPALLGQLRQRLHDRFRIDHTTLQLEPLGFEEGAVCR